MKRNNKIYLIIIGIACLFFLIGYGIDKKINTELNLGAPVSNVLHNILPETDDTYEIGSTSPQSRFLRIFLGTGTSTSRGGIESYTMLVAGDSTGTSTIRGNATSTFQGLRVETGAISFDTLLACNGASVLETDANGVIQCGADAGGTITINSGTANTLAYYSGASTIDSGTSFLFDNSASTTFVGALNVQNIHASSTAAIDGLLSIGSNGFISNASSTIVGALNAQDLYASSSLAVTGSSTFFGGAGFGDNSGAPTAIWVNHPDFGTRAILQFAGNGAMQIYDDATDIQWSTYQVSGTTRGLNIAPASRVLKLDDGTQLQIKSTGNTKILTIRHDNTNAIISTDSGSIILNGIISTASSTILTVNSNSTYASSTSAFDTELFIPNAASLSLTNAGALGVDTSSGNGGGQLTGATTSASGAVVWANAEKTIWAFTLASTSQPFATAEGFAGGKILPLPPLFYGVQVNKVLCNTLWGGTNVVFNLSDSDSANDTESITITSSVATGTEFAITTNNTFTVGEGAQFEISSVSGTPDSLSCRFVGTTTPQ